MGGHNFIDIAGHRFERYVVLELHSKTRDGARWVCRCDCGEMRVVYGFSLRNGGTRSCGCRSIENSKTHGLSGTPEHRAWKNMIQRCSNRKHIMYYRYGGRGIQVCDRWKDFPSFYADMGKKPSPGHSLDRIDSDGHYCPENCRWATKHQQANNTSRNVYVTIEGRTATVSEWCKLLLINKPNRVYEKLARGIEPRRALQM